MLAFTSCDHTIEKELQTSVVKTRSELDLNPVRKRSVKEAPLPNYRFKLYSYFGVQ